MATLIDVSFLWGLKLPACWTRSWRRAAVPPRRSGNGKICASIEGEGNPKMLRQKKNQFHQTSLVWVVCSVLTQTETHQDTGDLVWKLFMCSCKFQRSLPSFTLEDNFHSGSLVFKSRVWTFSDRPGLIFAPRWTSILITQSVTVCFVSSETEAWFTCRGQVLQTEASDMWWLLQCFPIFHSPTP